MSNQVINHITDLISVDYLQTVQDSLGHVFGTTTYLLDADGQAVTNISNLHSFCSMMHSSSAGIPLCENTHNRLIEICKQTGKPEVVTCSNSGLKVAAVPIFYLEKYLGCWNIGQIHMEELDTALIEQTAETLGVSKDFAISSVSSLPIISQAALEHMLDYLVTTTKTIVDFASVNATLNRRNAELSALAQKLDASLAAFKEFINFTDIGTYLVDYETGQLIICSNLYQEALNIVGDDYLNHKCYEYMEYDTFCPFCPKNKLLKPNGEPAAPFVWERYNEVTKTWLSITSRALKWIDGRMVMMTTFVNVTKRKEEEERIAYLAYNDQNFNIPNAVKLNKDITEKCGDHSYLIFFDIKSLKTINSVYGRTAGDALLSTIVEWFQQFVNNNITLYRISGDDFAVFVENSTDEAVMELADSTYLRFQSPWIVDMGDIKQSIYTSVQMGIIQISSPLDSHATLLNLGEKVLSFARSSSVPILFNAQMDQQYQEHMSLVVSLKSCVLNHMEGFSLNYQPVVDAKTEKWVGMEALCRWNSPDVGNIPPNVFIQEAEQLGIISTIGSWVFEEAIRQTKIWELDKLPHFSLSVNLSPIQLRDKALIKGILDTAAKYDYPIDRFTLEITETAQVPFDEYTKTLLQEIKNTGIRMSLDDFGTGYATFSSLRGLPVSTLKTDRSFITGIEDDEYVQHTLRAIVNFAHLADLTVTAEGVETAAQHEIVRQNGANYIQGFYFSKPMPKEELEKQLDRFR